MNKPVVIALLALVTLSGCDYPRQVRYTPKQTGPVTITAANYDYHSTIKFPDGCEKEFYYNVYQPLFEVGAIVDISFTGDSDSCCSAHITNVKVIKYSDSYWKHHPELWPERKGHWTNIKNDAFGINKAYVLDDTGQVCGELMATAKNDVFKVFLQDNSREGSEFVSFDSEANAEKEIMKACH